MPYSSPADRHGSGCVIVLSLILMIAYFLMLPFVAYVIYDDSKRMFQESVK